MENISLNELCQYGDNMEDIKYGIFVFSYYFMPVVFAITGTIGHSLSLAVYIVESKSKTPYLYQTQLIVSEIVTMIFAITFFLTYRIFSGGSSGYGGSDWYQRNYVSMWFAAHLSPVLLQNCNLAAFLLSVATTLDRLHALARPTGYNTMANKQRYPRVSLAISVALAVFLGVPDCFRNTMTKEGEKYRILSNSDPPAPGLLAFAQYARNVLEFGGTAMLILANVTIVLLYKRTGRIVVNSDKREAKRRTAERVLLFLCVSQSVFTFLPRVFNIIFETYARLSFTFAVCYGGIVASLLEVTAMICIVGSFYFNIICSSQFRTLVVRVLQSFKGTILNGKNSGTSSNSNRREDNDGNSNYKNSKVMRY